MYFKVTGRRNPDTQQPDWYYRLVESYRNALGEVRQRTVLSVGFIDYFSAKQINQIQQGLNDRIEGQLSLFEDPQVQSQIDYLYGRLIKENKIDSIRDEREKSKDWETIDMNSLKNKDIREVGAEWMSYQAIKDYRHEQFEKQRYSRGRSRMDELSGNQRIGNRIVSLLSRLEF